MDAAATARVYRGVTMAAVGRVLLAVTVALTGCAAPDGPAIVGAGPSAEGPRLPPVAGGFDYQLGGAYDTPGLAVVVRDATERPMPSAYGICYVNGFQTQPGDGDDWLRSRGAAVLRDAAGDPVVDPDWPDEYVLDPSTPAQRKVILDVLSPVLDDCAAKGFDAVEIDNLDTFSRFSEPATGRVDRAGALELARSLAALAHGRGLAIGQKNAAELTDFGHDEVGFDFAVAEECGAHGECASYRRAYGDHVLQIEYTDNLPAPFDEVCSSPDRAPLTILRDRDLVTRGAAGYAYEQCP